MPVYVSFIILIALFGILGFSANIVVNNIKKITHSLGVPTFILGMILGILTSLPELSIAVNASINGVTEVSIGNLFGGMMVVFGLILGFSLILNRRVKTDGKVMTPLPGFALLILPFVLALDSELGFIDGLIICVGYVGMLVYVYLRNHHHKKIDFVITVTKKKTILKELLFLIGGSLLIVAASNMIIKMTTLLLEQFNISGFLVGLLVFSLGTNLPELMVIITSWRKKLPEVSFSHMLGSAIVNSLILGIMALFDVVPITINESFFVIFYFLILTSIMTLFFYHTNKEMSRSEGAFLVVTFIIFTYIQFQLH